MNRAKFLSTSWRAIQESLQINDIKIISEADHTGEGLYVSVNLESKSAEVLSNNLKAVFGNSLIKDLSKLHITVMYDRSTAGKVQEVIDLANNKEFRYREALYKELKIINGHEDKKFLVLEVKSDALTELHQKWKAAGFEHSFPDYLQHVTITDDEADLVDIDNKISQFNAAFCQSDNGVTFTEELTANINE